MNLNEKQKMLNKSAYVVITLTLLSILLLTIIAISTTIAKKDKDKIKENNIVISDQNQNNEQDKPVIKEDENEENDTPVVTEPTEEEPTYTIPCNGYLQKEFSEDVLVFSATMNDHRVHMGIDISGKVGDPVVAFANGKIEKIYDDNFMGKTIIIDHGKNIKSYYMNLGKTIPDEIKEGIDVKAGTIIGSIGDTAISECADEPHLHFEIRVSEKKVNPASYIEIPKFDTESVYSDYSE